jgi:hypothetical protein
MIQPLLQEAQWQRRGLPTMVVVAIACLYVTAVLINAGGDPRAFVHYDGHYSFQIAHRSFENPGSIAQMPADYAFRDNVPSAYRYQRILYPMAARLLALGQPGLIPWTLILVNIAAIGLGTWATERILIHLDTSHWYALVYGLYGSNLIGLRANMTEPLAYALVQLAILAWLTRQRWWSVVAFALAILTKEIALLFVAAFVLYYLIRREWRWALAMGAAVMPYLLYQLVLYSWLGATGFRGNDPFILVPLGGWLMIARVDWHAFLLISLMIVPSSLIPMVAAFALSLRDIWRGFYHPFVFVLLAHAVLILILPHLTFREASAMVRVTHGLAAGMLLYGALTRSPRILNYSLLWLATNILLVKGTA